MSDTKKEKNHPIIRFLILGSIAFGCFLVVKSQWNKERSPQTTLQNTIADVWTWIRTPKEVFPEKFMLDMDNSSGRFEDENLVYGATKNGSIVLCKSFGLQGGLLGIGASAFTADLNFDLDNREGNWSVIYPKGEKPTQSGGLTVFPKEFGEYDVYFKNNEGEIYGKGVLKPQ